MYIRTPVDDFSGYGIAPAAVATAAGIGAAALSFAQAIFAQPNCNFCVSSTGVNYKHPITSRDRKYRRCEKLLLIRAFTPLPAMLNVTPDIERKKGWGEKFWFKLSYEYNGNDLNNVRVEPLINKSSDLRKSVFTISFAPDRASDEGDPVAEVVFRISGSWRIYRLGFTDTIVSFSGDLYVRADGSVRVEHFQAEKDYVWLGSLSNNCPLIAPFVPKRNFFSIAILFPFAKDNVSESEVRRLYEWVSHLPASTREKFSRGEITVNIDGFASRPGREL